MKLQTIVVGIDFSPFSEVARLRALELAVANKAKVILVHSLEDSDYQPQQEWLASGAKFEKLIEEGQYEAKKHLDELAVSDRSDVLEILSEVSELEPAAALVDAAERHNADLVVVGPHGRTGFERLSLAKTAERIVRKSPCSVLVARAAEKDVPYMSRFLVPTDFSESANVALAVACSLVAHGGRVDVLHCWMRPFYAIGDEGLAAKSVSMDEEISESVSDAGAKLINKHSKTGVAMHFEERHDTVARGVHEALEATAYDMVIMGSHGRKGLGRLLLGSAAEATARHANCSVLVVR